MEDHGQEESDLHLGPFYCQSGSKVTNIFWLVMSNIFSCDHLDCFPRAKFGVAGPMV